MDNRDEFEAWYADNHTEFSDHDFSLMTWNAARASQWRPIAEAPKDGQAALICSSNHLWITVGKFVSGKWTDGLWPLLDPTHFMPLPQPPENV